MPYEFKKDGEIFMENFTLPNTLDVCGFHELDASGTVLYSRPKHDGKLDKLDQRYVGLNFFEKIFVCPNSESLRRRFADFVSSRNTSETFIFSCRIAENIVSLRVMFVRVSERNAGEREVIFYIDIKPN
jgi:hypothetical protein